MKNLILSLILIGSLGSAFAQELDEAKDPDLFERLPGFEIYDYSRLDFGAYRFCNPEGDNIIVEGMISYYYYETEGVIDPLKIINKFSSAVIARGGRVYGDDPHQKYMYYKDDFKMVWVDLYAEDFYYTLNIIEKGEIISDIKSEDLLKSLEQDGKAVLYFNFDRDRCEIKEECQSVLEMLAGVFSANPGLEVSIIGYTDNIGRSDLNLALSQNRAKALADKLIELGVSGDRLSWDGLGEKDPVASNSTLEGRTLNNRIVIVEKK